MCGGLLFLCGLPMLIIAVVLASITLMTPDKYPVYKIRPTDCDLTLPMYKDAPEWRLGEYYLLYEYGACPVLGRTTSYILKRVKQTTSNHHYTYKTMNVSIYVYHHCINNVTQWTSIDEGNKANGYTDSHLMIDSLKWDTATKNIFFSPTIGSLIMLTLVIIPPLVYFLPSTEVEKCISSVITFWLFFVVVVAVGCTFVWCWLSVPMLVTGTDQINSTAWSTFYFQSCNVQIVHGQGLSFVWVIGLFAMFIMMMIVGSMFDGSFGGSNAFNQSNQSGGVYVPIDETKPGMVDDMGYHPVLVNDQRTIVDDMGYPIAQTK